MLAYISFVTGAVAFALQSNGLIHSSVRRRSSAVLFASKSNNNNNNNNNNAFDMSKPVFDLFSLRSIRGDALLRYNTLNQSEPLRINLYALLAITLFSAPMISESVGGEAINTVQTIATTCSGIISTGLFVRECQRRSNQLNRMEKELNAENLQIRVAANVWSDRPYEKPQTLRTLRQSSNPPRILALSGTASELKTAVIELRILGRRLQQSSTYVVLVPQDAPVNLSFQASWLAEAYNVDEWKGYFNDLSPTNEFRWFGLNFNGRSFGSGSGEFPQWLELLGQYLRPNDLLDQDMDSQDGGGTECASVLQAQKAFYAALTTGDLDAMNAIYFSDFSEQVTEVVNAGGRIDSWKDCLIEGARPEGMQIANSDACILSEKEAYSTVIEFPINTVNDTATLLAVQKWVRSSRDDQWKLQLHQTIPWSRDTRAQGTLRCDCRGCVALTRTSERSTFGGLIG